jgi:hypothetical protein
MDAFDKSMKEANSFSEKNWWKEKFGFFVPSAEEKFPFIPSMFFHSPFMTKKIMTACRCSH